MLEWPKETSEQPGSSREVTGDVTEKPGNPLDYSQAWAPEGSDTLSRLGDWTITKNDAVITLHSDTGNLAVRCSDATMTYMAFIRISDPRSITGRPEVKPPPFFNFTAWADSNEPADFSFLVGYPSDAYAAGMVVRSVTGMRPPPRHGEVRLRRRKPKLLPGLCSPKQFTPLQRPSMSRINF